MNDVVIVGGGIIGSILMLLLRQLGYKVVLIEKKPEIFHSNDPLDVRNFALSRATKQMLEALGIWQELKTIVPIYNIHVSSQGYFGHANFENKGKPLGHVVVAHELHYCIAQKIKEENIIFNKICNLDVENNVVYLENSQQIKAKIIIAADGADSTIRKYCKLDYKDESYDESAIVTNIKLTKNHNFQAFERFTKTGLMALLPMQNNCMALIWANDLERSKSLLSLESEDFLKELHKTFGFKLGQFLDVGNRSLFNLRYLVMQDTIYNNILFIGNAASTLHPVAGQGLNLGLRDVAMLIECIQDIGLTKDALIIYAKKRAKDRDVIAKSTNGIINIFRSKLPGAALARSIGLILLDNSPILKNLLAHYASGFGGHLSKLICGTKLKPNIINREVI